MGLLRQSATDQRTRDHAHEVLCAAIVRFWLPDADQVAVVDLLDRYDIDPHVLRRAAAAVLDALPDLTTTAGQWCSHARQILTTAPPRPDLTTPAGTQLTAPRNRANHSMRAVAGLGVVVPEQPVGRHATIHQVKGEEAEAVLVLLPDDTRTDRVLHRWTSGCPGTEGPAATVADIAEALRVLYVAVTRARQLLALSLPARHLEPLAQFLTSREVLVAAVALPGGCEPNGSAGGRRCSEAAPRDARQPVAWP